MSKINPKKIDHEQEIFYADRARPDGIGRVS